MNETTRCIARPERIQWALIRAGMLPNQARAEATCRRWTMREAEYVADLADVQLAALYLPNPSRVEMLRARIHGLRHDGRLAFIQWTHER